MLTVATWRSGPTPRAELAWEQSMNRYAAHLCFTLAAIWIALIFVLVSGVSI